MGSVCLVGNSCSSSNWVSSNCPDSDLPCLVFDQAHHFESKLREPVVTVSPRFTSKRVKGETVGEDAACII